MGYYYTNYLFYPSDPTIAGVDPDGVVVVVVVVISLLVDALGPLLLLILFYNLGICSIECLVVITAACCVVYATYLFPPYCYFSYFSEETLSSWTSPSSISIASCVLSYSDYYLSYFISALYSSSYCIVLLFNLFGVYSLTGALLDDSWDGSSVSSRFSSFSLLAIS